MHCLQRRLRNTSISVTSVHPGMVRTEIGRDFTDSKAYQLFLGINRVLGLCMLYQYFGFAILVNRTNNSQSVNFVYKKLLNTTV